MARLLNGSINCYYHSLVGGSLVPNVPDIGCHTKHGVKWKSCLKVVIA